MPVKKKKKVVHSKGLHNILGAIEDSKHNKFKLRMKLKDNIDEYYKNNFQNEQRMDSLI